MMSDRLFMEQALALARQAAKEQEVPVGAVVVQNGKIIASGYNRKETFACATKHAEILAIEKASQILGAWRLHDCELFVTLEPCLMCAGAIFSARLRRVVFGAHDPKGGALGSLYRVHEDSRLNHNFTVTPGVMEAQCADILKQFFSARRKSAKKN